MARGLSRTGGLDVHRVTSPLPHEEPPKTEESVQGAVLGWLRLLWPDGLPDRTSLVLWSSPKRKPSRCSTLEDAAAEWPRVEQELRGESLYLTTAAMREGLEGYKRGARGDVRALPALALDLDTRDGKHDAQNLPTKEESLRFLDGLLHPPSVVLDSGGGLYPFWLLDEPWEPGDAFDAQGALLDLQAGACAALGPKAAEGADLPRVLRPVGGRNHKYGTRVRMVRGGEDPPRYSPSDIEELLSTLEDRPKASEDVTSAADGRRITGPRPPIGPAAEWVVALARELGTVAEGADHLRLHLCPACGGGRSRDTGTAWLSPTTGRLKCFRESCDLGGGRGASAGVWIPEHLGSDAWKRWSEARDLELLPDRPPSEDDPGLTTAPPEEWPEVDLEGDDLPHLVREWIHDTRGHGEFQVQLREVAGGAGKTRALARVMAWAAAESVGIETPLRSTPAAGEDGNTSQQELHKGELAAEAASEASTLLRSALLFRNHQDAQAWLQELRGQSEALGVQVPVRYVRGISQTLEDGSPACARRSEWIDGGARAAALARRKLCGSCSHRSTCEVARAASPAELVIGVVAGLESMAHAGMLDGRVVVLDESPKASEDVTVGSDVLEGLASSAHLYGPRRQQNVRRFAARGAEIREAVVQAFSEREPSRHGWDLSLEEALSMVPAEAAAEFVLAGAHLARADRRELPDWEGAPKGPEDVLHPIEVEALWAACVGMLERFPSEGGGRLAQELEERTQQPLEWSSSSAFIVVTAAGRVSWEVHQRGPWRHAMDPVVRFDHRTGTFGIKQPAGCLVLSATARASAPLLEASLGGPGAAREVVVRGGRPKGRDVLGCGRTVVKYAGASRSGTLARGRLKRNEPTSRSRLAQMLEGALTRFRDQDPERWDAVRGSVGVITYKPLARILLGLDAEAMGDREEVLGVLEELGVTLASTPDRSCDSDLGRPAVGWWGRDDTASNAFREVRLLLLLGQPTPNLGAVARQARTLGVAPEDVQLEHEATSIAQAVYRLRHLRRQEQVHVLGLFRDAPGIDRSAWTSVREVGESKTEDPLEALLQAARSGEVFLTQNLVERWLEDFLPLCLRGTNRPRGKKSARTLITKAKDRLTSDGWEVLKASPFGRGRPWTVVVRAGTDQAELEAEIRELLEKWDLAAQTAQEAPEVPSAGVATHARARGEQDPNRPKTVVDVGLELLEDPEAQAAATANARFMLESLALPEVSLETMLRAHAGEAAERIHAVALQLVGAAMELVEDPQVTVEGTGRGTLRLVRDHRWGRSSAAAILAWSCAAEAIESRSTEATGLEAMPRPG